MMIPLQVLSLVGMTIVIIASSQLFYVNGFYPIHYLKSCSTTSQATTGRRQQQRQRHSKTRTRNYSCLQLKNSNDNDSSKETSTTTPICQRRRFAIKTTINSLFGIAIATTGTTILSTISMVDIAFAATVPSTNSTSTTPTKTTTKPTTTTPTSTSSTPSSAGTIKPITATNNAGTSPISASTVSSAASSKPVATNSGISSKTPSNPGDVKNCPDFATYNDAKLWFDTYYPLYGDVAKLDGNNDGIPCESLPGAPNKKK